LLLENLPNEVSQEKQEQQASDSSYPDEKVCGQLGGIDFFFIHEGTLLLPGSGLESFS
jgi:hypothetical protein